MQRNASEGEIERDETRKEGKDMSYKVKRLLGELACWMSVMLEERERV